MEQILVQRETVDSLEDYRAAGGGDGLRAAREQSPEQVVQLISDAGLRGRGGGGFPTGRKWLTLLQDDAARKFVCCNGAEGEPGTFKDRYLLRHNPYQVLEGVLIAAHVLAAERAYVCLKQSFATEIARVQRAIAELVEAGLCQPGAVELVAGPEDYLFGEEKALLEVIQGDPPLPRNLAPYMEGLFTSPTERNPALVNNVETFANVPHIVRRGADWFRTHGTDESPGTMLMTLVGDVARPGMYEVELGTSVSELLERHGGGPAGDAPFKAVLSGVANPVLPATAFAANLGFDSLRQAGAGLGAGGFIVYDESAPMAKVALLVSEFLYLESCNQCPPCKTGCQNITEQLRVIADGQGAARELASIRSWCKRVDEHVRCYLATQEAVVVTSILDQFAGEMDAFVRAPRDFPRTLELPLIADYDHGSGFTFSDEYLRRER